MIAIITAYTWWKLLHLLGALGFVMVHGVSIAVLFRLRTERDAARVHGLLDLSRSTTKPMYVTLLVTVVGGIVTASRGGWWRAGWLWLSIGLLVAMTVAGVALARPYYARLRLALASGDDMATLMGSHIPAVVAAVGFASLGAIVFLMVAKPF